MFPRARPDEGASWPPPGPGVASRPRPSACRRSRSGTGPPLFCGAGPPPFAWCWPAPLFLRGAGVCSCGPVLSVLESAGVSMGSGAGERREEAGVSLATWITGAFGMAKAAAGTSVTTVRLWSCRFLRKTTRSSIMPRISSESRSVPLSDWLQRQSTASPTASGVSKGSDPSDTPASVPVAGCRVGVVVGCFVSSGGVVPVSRGQARAGLPLAAPAERASQPARRQTRQGSSRLAGAGRRGFVSRRLFAPSSRPPGKGAGTGSWPECARVTAKGGGLRGRTTRGTAVLTGRSRTGG